MKALRPCPRRHLLRLLVGLCCAAALNTFAAEEPSVTSSLDAEKFFSAIVKVRARALPDARSAATLGSEPEGSVVVSDKAGVKVPSGYRIRLADEGGERNALDNFLG